MNSEPYRLKVEYGQKLYDEFVAHVTELYPIKRILLPTSADLYKISELRGKELAAACMVQYLTDAYVLTRSYSMDAKL